MADNNNRSTSGAQDTSFTWNFNNVPISINAQGDLGRVVQDILPEIERRVRSHSQTSTTSEGNSLLGNTNMSGQAEMAAPGQNPQAVVGVVPQQRAANQPHRHGHSHHGHGHDHGHGHGHGHQHHQHRHSPLLLNRSESEGSGGDQPSFIINMGNDSTQSQNGVDHNQNPADQNGSQGNGDQLQGLPTLRTLWKNTEGSVPFLLLLFAKTMYNHRLGILVLGAMFGTFFHANSSLRKQIAQRDNGGSWLEICGSLAWIITFLSANIFFVYFFFEEQELHRSLYLCLPEVSHVDVWTLLWVVGITDFVIKFATIIVKTLVAMLPKLVLPFKKKGKYYMMVETLSQFYRSLIPITPWVYFLLDDEHGGQWFSVVLLVVYALCKGYHMWMQLKELAKAYQKFKCDVSYGSVPDSQQMQSADNSCAICQDKFTDPVLLSCKHIFCEDCVSMWFDRERTCPMCRANIVDNPVWRDGSTCGNIQLY